VGERLLTCRRVLLPSCSGSSSPKQKRTAVLNDGTTNITSQKSWIFSHTADVTPPGRCEVSLAATALCAVLRGSAGRQSGRYVQYISLITTNFIIVGSIKNKWRPPWPHNVVVSWLYQSVVLGLNCWISGRCNMRWWSESKNWVMLRLSAIGTNTETCCWVPFV